MIIELSQDVESFAETVLGVRANGKWIQTCSELREAMVQAWLRLTPEPPGSCALDWLRLDHSY
jgi:hypothetical protein